MAELQLGRVMARAWWGLSGGELEVWGSLPGRGGLL
jgi:hypothetical protein